MALRFALHKRAVMANPATYSAHFTMIQSHFHKASYRMTIHALAEHGRMIIWHHMTLGTTSYNVFVIYQHITSPTGVIEMTAAAVCAGLHVIERQIHSVAIFTTS
jgi:hypothetical protein